MKSRELLIGDSVKKIKTLVFSIVTDMLKTKPVEDLQRCGNNVSIGL
jgi:hypothetical protein